MKRRSLLVAALAAPAIVPGVALGQGAWPSKTVKFICPFAAGGGTDTVSRLMCDQLSKALGQTFVVENKGGAGGNIGTVELARAAPDGYTIGLISVASHTLNPMLYSRLPYNPDKDIVAVSRVALLANLLGVTPSLPANNVAELIALCKKEPGKYSFASSGPGTSLHLSGELFKKMTGVDMTHIPYKGGGPATADLIGGHVQISFATTTSIVEAIRANKVRPIAVTSATRFALFPDLPTLSESGVPGFVTEEMQGIVAPALVPKPIIDKLNREIVRILTLPEVRDRLVNLGATPVAGTPAEFADYLRTESAKWAEVFKGTGITAE